MPLRSEIPITDEYAALIGNPLSLLGKAALLPLIVRGIKGSKAFRMAAKRFAKGARKIEDEMGVGKYSRVSPETSEAASFPLQKKTLPYSGRTLEKLNPKLSTKHLPYAKPKRVKELRTALMEEFKGSGLEKFIDDAKESERVMEGVKNLFGGLK